MKPVLICGNGPSLLGQLERLRRIVGFETFACNRLSLSGIMPFVPTYYACSANAILKGIEPQDPPAMRDIFLVSRRRDELDQFGFPWRKVYKKESHSFLAPDATDLLVKGGGTMPSIMAQLAVWMGYREIFFVGIEQQPGGHVFDPEGKHMPYFIPSEERLFTTWREMVAYYKPHGVTMRDCTPDGRLNEILGYVPLQEALEVAA